MIITDDTKLIPGDVIKYIDASQTFYADVLKVAGTRITFRFYHWKLKHYDTRDLYIFVGQHYKRKFRTYKQIFIHKLMDNK